jgi:hypothetical protein
MRLAFNEPLAIGLQDLHRQLGVDRPLRDAFRGDPTGTARKFLRERGVQIEDPDTFHVHALRVGQSLPQEPQRATVDRYIYIFRETGLFEFKVVPGSPDGDDAFMSHPTGACACCNCGCLVVTD